MNEKIKNLLNNTEKLLALADKVREKADETIVTEFHTALSTELDAWLAGESATNIWESLFDATFVPEDGQKDAMVEATEEATKIVGDWTVEAAKLAQKLWEAKLGLKKIEKVGYDELFENDELAGLSSYTRESLSELADEAFVFVNEGTRRFPITSPAEAFLAIKSLSLASEDRTEDELAVIEAAVAQGVGINYVDIMVSEGIPLAQLSLDENDDVDDEDLAMMAEAYQLTEEETETFFASVEAFRKVYTEPITQETVDNFPKPLVLNAASIVSKFAKRESQNDSLAPLVGLVRTLGISKEKFEDAAKTYNCFGVTVLQKLLERAFAAPSTNEESGSDDAQSESQISTLSNPVAKPTSGEAGKPSPIKSSLDLAFTPINRRSLKKKNTK